MNNYTVQIIESGSKILKIEAESEYDAIAMVRDMYECGEFDLYSDVEFEVL